MSKRRRPTRISDDRPVWPGQDQGSLIQTASNDADLITRIYTHGAVGGRTHQ